MYPGTRGHLRIKWPPSLQKAQVFGLAVGGDGWGAVNKRVVGGLVAGGTVTGVRNDTGRRVYVGSGLRGRGGDKTGGSGSGVGFGDGVGEGRNSGRGADGDERRGDGGGNVKEGSGDGEEVGEGARDDMGDG